MAKRQYLIGAWRFDPAESVLHSQGVARRLEHRTARALELLCDRRGDVVSKDELLEVVWQGRSVSANSVAIVIGDLRRALGDDPRAPVHIVTINKRGYRLTEGDAAPVQGGGRARRHDWRLSVAGGVAVLCIGLAGLQMMPRAPVDLLVEPTRNETGRADYDALARSLDAVVTDRAARLPGVRALSPPAAPSGREPLVLSPRLIMWNGAPELAMTVRNKGTRAVVWSAFAGGPAGGLAQATASRLLTLAQRLARRRGPFSGSLSLL